MCDECYPGLVMQEQPDISIQRQSTAEAVADTLMRMIVSGKLKAGEPLRESSLAPRLGISRNSLREGIRLLEQSRLVKYEIHRGAIVSTPTAEDLEDLYRSRLYIETLAVQQEVDEQQLDEIRAAFVALKDSTKSGEAEPIVTADLDLHQVIVGLLGSERISAFYGRMRKEMVFYFTVLSYADSEFTNPEIPIVTRHQEIYEALRDGRRKDAADLLHDHIQLNYERLKSILLEA